ncbi:hypothetical protein ALC53_00898 [Atta colombica]|uniref:Uncharacterized protein n=1 Tax=Atta colombica TaxID=520822 RepID=A0A195BWU6_9HYME|nr:hypothetical protein ALC53_00898 [Atta colombica]
MPQRSLISRSALQHHYYTISPMWMFFSHSHTNVLSCRAQAELHKRQHLCTDYNVPLYNVYTFCKARQCSRGLMAKDHRFLHNEIANSAIDKIMNYVSGIALRIILRQASSHVLIDIDLNRNNKSAFDSNMSKRSCASSICFRNVVLTRRKSLMPYSTAERLSLAMIFQWKFETS